MERQTLILQSPLSEWKYNPQYIAGTLFQKFRVTDPFFYFNVCRKVLVEIYPDKLYVIENVFDELSDLK